jgi:predicted acyl esterase
MASKEGSQPIYSMKVEGTDIMVPMRDGVRLAADVYRPDAEGRFPALLAFAFHNKFLQSPVLSDACRNQPAWAPLWCGAAEAGDSTFFASRGYVHVIGNVRGYGNSEGSNPRKEGRTDAYDLIEWIARQPWCDGNVGMIGLSSFGRSQMAAALLKPRPPHLKAIFPFDPGTFFFRYQYTGGVLHAMQYQMAKSAAENLQDVKLTPEEEELWPAAMKDPDYRMYPNIIQLLERRGKMPLKDRLFDILLNPYEREDNDVMEEAVSQIDIPFYTGSGWYAYPFKGHLFGSLDYWQKCNKAPFKKMLLDGPAIHQRPWIDFHDEVLRWYDYWLKGIDTGIKDEPRVKIWVMGANRWRYSDDWPLKETQWTKLYLDSWERLRWQPFTPASRDGVDAPDCFVQMPLSQTRTVQKLRYVTDPLPEDLEVTGPLSLHLWAEIDQDDTNWVIVIKDLGPDVSVQSAREGEFERPAVFEREITRGWLKASHRAIDEKKSLPGQPYHPLTRSAQQPVKPGEINRYDIEIAATSNVFKRDHRICIDITAMDVPTGVYGTSSVEYIPYHICSSKTTVHKIYRCLQYPSHLLLPVIPASAASGD